MYLFALVVGATTALFFASSTAYVPDRSHYNASSYCASHSAGNEGFTSVVPLKQVPTSFQDPAGPQNPEDFVQIQNTNMLYPLAVDGKNFGSLSNVFAQNVVANLSQGPVLTGLNALEGALAGSLAKVNSHHNLGTQYINIAESGCTAESITYFHASLIGVGPTAGQIVYALGQYQDSWVKQSVGWRISARNLVYMAPFIGNASIVE